MPVQLIAAALGAPDGILGRVASFGCDDQLAARQEFSANFDRFIQQAAGIPAQIEDQRLHPLLFEPVERRFEFGAGFVAKFRDAHITNFVRPERKFFLPLMSLTMYILMMARVSIKSFTMPDDGR